MCANVAAMASMQRLMPAFSFSQVHKYSAGSFENSWLSLAVVCVLLLN